ncbi:MAG TPA: GAF and ANTAR domain-containing protein [Mycobacterium sp.]|uniref:GAF and ANTAR domain-containing protein n=1 Tax=Mycobacterium sp. TaxID=1785 RepID=UPI002F416A35
MNDTSRHTIHLQIAALARDLNRERPTDIDAALDELTHAAVSQVPGATDASLTVTRRGRIETPAETGPYPALLNQLHRDHGEGPCLEAAWEHHTVRVDDLAHDVRWPNWRREALDRTPIRSLLSFEMFANEHTMGALNLYAEQSHAFTTESVDIGLVYATHTAIAWNALRRDDQFHSALASRDIIGQAKGMLMERYKIDAVKAFKLLTRLSQMSNTRIVEISQKLVEAEHPD